jgi:hypothetical protein
MKSDWAILCHTFYFFGWLRFCDLSYARFFVGGRGWCFLFFCYVVGT